MFKTQVFIGMSCFILALSIYICLFYFPSLAALQAYKDLIELKGMHEKKGSLAHNKKQIQQQREQTTKQLIFTQNGQRSQLRLSSDRSDLVFNQQRNQSQLIEYFENLSCLIQEKLVYVSEEDEKFQHTLSSPHPLQPKQYVRYLKAKKGTYSYQTGEMKADQVQFVRHLLPGHSWPTLLENDPPLLKGEVKEMEWVLYKNKNPNFKAHQCHLTLQEESG